MRTKLLSIVAAALAFTALPALAQAPAQGKVYLGAHLGLSIFHDSDVKTPVGTSTAAFTSGLAFGVTAGYKLDQNLRLEGEIAYKKNDVDTIDGASVSGYDLTVWSFMANGYYDFTQAKLPVTPFVGLGLGAVHGTMSTPSPAQGGYGDLSDTELGYQLTLGLSYAVNPNATLYAAYRYQSAFEFQYDVDAGGGTTVRIKVPYGSSNVLVGLNYLF